MPRSPNATTVRRVTARCQTTKEQAEWFRYLSARETEKLPNDILDKESLKTDIIAAIVNGKNPPQLTAKKLMRLALEIPVDWTAQRRLFGFQAR